MPCPSFYHFRLERGYLEALLRDTSSPRVLPPSALVAPTESYITSHEGYSVSAKEETQRHDWGTQAYLAIQYSHWAHQWHVLENSPGSQTQSTRWRCSGDGKTFLSVNIKSHECGAYARWALPYRMLSSAFSPQNPLNIYNAYAKILGHKIWSVFHHPTVFKSRVVRKVYLLFKWWIFRGCFRDLQWQTKNRSGRFAGSSYFPRAKFSSVVLKSAGSKLLVLAEETRLHARLRAASRKKFQNDPVLWATALYSQSDSCLLSHNGGYLVDLLACYSPRKFHRERHPPFEGKVTDSLSVRIVRASNKSKMNCLHT